MNEAEAIELFTLELRQFLLTGKIERPTLLRAFVDDKNRLYIYSVRNEGYPLGIVEKYAIRVRPTTVYMDVWREFSKQTKRHIYTPEALRCPRAGNRMELRWDRPESITLHTPRDIEGRIASNTTTQTVEVESRPAGLVGRDYPFLDEYTSHVEGVLSADSLNDLSREEIPY